MSRYVKYCLALPLMVLFSCSNDNDGFEHTGRLKEFEPIAFTSVEVEAMAHANQFGWNLLKAVDEQESGNFMISPLSAVMNLSMLANGAQGETLTQILDALEVGEGDLSDLNRYSKKMIEGLPTIDGSAELQIANALFVKPDFKVREGYESDLRKWYDAEVLQLGESKYNQVNQWVQNKTNRRITNIITPEEEAKASFVLANAMYFDGIWSSPFSESATVEGVFRAAERYNRASFMCKTTKVEIGQNDSFAMARLDFGNGAFSIYFILPLEGVQLDRILSTIDESLLASLNPQVLNVNLRVPKFKMESKINLIEPLKQCGIVDAFDVLSADFSNIADHCPMISFMRQGCVFGVDERGVKAAAATVSGAVTASPIVDKGDFFLDKPFLFMIKENSSGMYLFMGKVEYVSD